MQLYSASAPNRGRALLVIEEPGLPYALHLLDLANHDRDQAEFRRLNPFGHVPVLVDPDGLEGKPVTVMQSGAVIFYLARKLPLVPLPHIRSAIDGIEAHISSAGVQR